MNNKNLRKIFKKSLTPELREYFKLIQQITKTQKHFDIKDMISYDILISGFKTNLNQLQVDLFLEIYNTPVQEDDVDFDRPAISLRSADDFKNEFLYEEIRNEIYTALVNHNLAIDYTKLNSERKIINACKFDSNFDPTLKSERSTKDEKVLVKDEKDGILKDLFIAKIHSITILPY